MTVADTGRVEADLEAVARRRIGGDRRPRAAAGRRALEVDMVDARAGVRCGGGQRLGGAQILAGVVLARRGRRVVDAHVRDRAGGRGVAGHVVRDDAQLVDAVRDPGRVPGDAVERRRRDGADRRPGRGVRRVLVGDGGKPRRITVGRRVVLGRRERDGLADVRAGARHRPGRGRGVPMPRPRRR